MPEEPFALYGNPNGYLDILDALSNRYLGTTGRSRGSWDAAKGCYAGGLFTGCRSSANHAVWERIVRLTRAAYRAQYRKDFDFATWSWPGSIPSPFLFRRDGRAYYDAACTQPANALARFASSDVGETAPRARSWTEVLRAAGYVTTHDMTHPGRRDGAPLTMMRRELPLNAAYSRRDALAYGTSRTVSYEKIAREFSAGDYTNDMQSAARKMYDAGGSFRAFVEAVRHDTASGLVHGEVIDSEDTFSERLFLDQALGFCRRAGVRVITRKEAHGACFGERRTCGNLIRNPGLVNSAALFVPDARTLPANPDGYLGDCRVEAMADGADRVRALVTAGPVTNLVCGVPPGRLAYGVRARGKGRIRIFAVRNSSPVTLCGLEELAAVSVDSAAFASYGTDVAVPDAPEGAYEPRWEGLGGKVMGLLIVYDPGLTLTRIRLRTFPVVRTESARSSFASGHESASPFSAQVRSREVLRQSAGAKSDPLIVFNDDIDVVRRAMKHANATNCCTKEMLERYYSRIVGRENVFRIIGPGQLVLVRIGKAAR